MGIRYNKTLYNSAAAGNGAWIRLDSRYEEMSNRTIQVALTASDTIKIQGTTKDLRGADSTFTSTFTANDISDITTISASGAYTLVGPWTYIRAVKTGTTANAKVQGLV